MNWQQHIQVDPAICKGRACITGTRITVSSVLDNLADGMTVGALVASYPPPTYCGRRTRLHGLCGNAGS